MSEILHRDIKPLNSFVSQYGVTKIGDFGVARFVDAITRTHTVNGAMSPAYASPEQWKGEKYTKEMDMYQLGCTLYQLFTARLPFESNGIYALMNSHLNDAPEPPTFISSEISDNLSNAILRLLNKIPDSRGDLWELNDVIASELHGKYEMQIDVHDMDVSIIDLVHKITDFEKDTLSNQYFQCDFPDFSEVLSESIELILNGIYDFRVMLLEEVKSETPITV